MVSLTVDVLLVAVRLKVMMEQLRYYGNGATTRSSYLSNWLLQSIAACLFAFAQRTCLQFVFR